MKVQIKNVKKLALGILLFYIIFMPDFSGVCFIFKNSLILVFLTGILLFIQMTNRCFAAKKKLFGEVMCIIGISLYTFFLTLVLQYDIRSNLSGILLPLKIVDIWIIQSILKKNGYKKRETIDFLIHIANIQAILCILMLLIRPLKNIANMLYISGVTNYSTSSVAGIVRYRIYGIFGDYTCSGQIFMAMMASISLVFFLNGESKYGIFALIQLFSAFLNGRTGFLIFIFSLLFIVPMSGGKIIKKKYGVKIMCLLIFFSFFVIAVLQNERILAWIVEGKNIILGLCQRKEDVILNKMWILPNGFALIFGEGHRVFGDFGRKIVGQDSDIGYVNDVFRGGIFYCSVYYGITIKMLIDIVGGDEESKKYYSKIRIILFLFLFISNYKGETATGSAVMCGIWFLIFSLRNVYEIKNGDECCGAIEVRQGNDKCCDVSIQ